MGLLLAACQGAPPSGVKPSPSPSATASATPTAVPTPTPRSQQDEPPLPVAREETAAAATADRLYVIGGFDGSGQSRPEVYVFDGHSYTNGPPLPIGLDHPSAAEFDGAIYLAGGFANGPASARVFKLDAGAPAWTEIAPMHHARGALALVQVHERLYAIGGNSGGVQVAPVEELDPAAGTWTDVAQLPQPRNHVAGFGLGALACVAGGRTPNVTRVDCLNVDSHAWAQLAPLPQATSGAGGAAVLNSFPVVAGGEDPGESRIVDQVARYANGGWTSEPMLHPRHGFQLAPFHGRLWACGGGEQAGLHPVTTCTSIAV